MRAALTALTMAEYFRDEKGEDVLLFIDNIFRFAQAGSEVSDIRIPAGTRNFSFLQNVHTGPRAHPASYSTDTGVISRG